MTLSVESPRAVTTYCVLSTVGCCDQLFCCSQGAEPVAEAAPPVPDHQQPVSQCPAALAHESKPDHDAMTSYRSHNRAIRNYHLSVAAWRGVVSENSVRVIRNPSDYCNIPQSSSGHRCVVAVTTFLVTACLE
ncbi:hypothetical protein J6590_045052 [Homalodisca vitripennis]|nr:hypothetical protein J6590_045052 [Homalodisca vitripennis]